MNQTKNTFTNFTHSINNINSHNSFNNNLIINDYSPTNFELFYLNEKDFDDRANINNDNNWRNDYFEFQPNANTEE